ncbi:MAG TPA: SAM-dependent methyltransferase [Acidimicrobiales bacterium]
MTDRTRQSASDGDPRHIDIDTTVAHPARIHNYLAGGDAHFAADREAVDQAASVVPGGVATVRRAVQAITSFQRRVIHHLVGERGIRQLIKAGTAVPAGEDVHEVALPLAPDVRVVYVGHDPMVLANAHALRRSAPEGAVAYVHGSLQDLDRVLREAGETLDLARPVGVLLPATLNFIPDARDPYGIVARLVAALASGSYVALTHASHDIRSERMQEAAERFSKLLAEPYVVRTRDEIARFFAGLDLVEPGLVPIDEWRPGTGGEPEPDVEGRPPPLYGAVGRKP